MARLYANENFDRSIVEALRALGHDVLTTLEAGKANQGIADAEVLAFAKASNRMVITFNRLDFIRLHRHSPDHSGIIVCTRNPDSTDLALRIHQAIQATGDNMAQQLIRIYRGG